MNSKGTPPTMALHGADIANYINYIYKNAVAQRSPSGQHSRHTTTDIQAE